MDARRAYIEAILSRLRCHYAERRPMPTGETLSLGLLQRLYRYVLTEGYGR